MSKDLTKIDGTIANYLSSHMEELFTITKTSVLKATVIKLIKESNSSENAKIKAIYTIENSHSPLSTITTWIAGIKV